MSAQNNNKKIVLSTCLFSHSNVSYTLNGLNEITGCMLKYFTNLKEVMLLNVILPIVIPPRAI